MNTPAHAVLNLVLLEGKGRTGRTAPVFWGAVLPDVPMFGFYLFERGIREVSEAEIWSRLYLEERWQTLFDLFHSLPLIGLGFLFCRRLRAPRPAALFASMGLHSLCDLVLHHDDAHRHFFPLLNWRFHSPVSYWDPRYHGAVIAPLEAVGVGIGLLLLLRRRTGRPARILLGSLLGLYTVFWGFILWTWF